jgi:membrane fusion protein (multidrug efflux system)
LNEAFDTFEDARMADPFPRSARVLGGESPIGARLLLASGVILLVAWGVWCIRARVPVYEASDQARLEVLRATHPVDAPAAGRVIAVHLVLDATVNAGDVLVELDATQERQRLAEARAKRAGIAPQIDATRKQAAAEGVALGAFRGQLGSTLQEAEQHLQEGEILAREGGIEADRAKRLFAEKLVSESEVVRTQAEYERREASVLALKATVERLRRESATGAGDREAKVASLQRDVAHLDADLGALEATIDSLVEDIERRTIRAPASGRLGEIGTARVGSVLAQGERIATVVAGGDLRVVASFAPSAALGRVHAGQRARIRLDGFPWTEYGALEASVSQVATELRDGHARVELVVEPNANTRIPLQHGLPGVAEITVEEVSPATLVLRAVGRLGLKSQEPNAPASTTTATSGP